MIASLITKLFTFLLSVIASLISIILAPLSAAVTALIPDLHTWVVQIENFINTYVPAISYFISWVGPFTLSVIRLELSFVTIFFTAYTFYLVIETTIFLITKIKSMFN